MSSIASSCPRVISWPSPEYGPLVGLAEPSLMVAAAAAASPSASPDPPSSSSEEPSDVPADAPNDEPSDRGRAGSG